MELKLNLPVNHLHCRARERFPTDCLIYSGFHFFPAHRFVLACYSLKFAEMFKTCPVQVYHFVVDCNYVQSDEVVTSLLDLLYGQRVIATPFVVHGIRVISEMYDMTDVLLILPTVDTELPQFPDPRVRIGVNIYPNEDNIGVTATKKRQRSESAVVRAMKRIKNEPDSDTDSVVLVTTKKPRKKYAKRSSKGKGSSQSDNCEASPKRNRKSSKTIAKSEVVKALESGTQALGVVKIKEEIPTPRCRSKIPPEVYEHVMVRRSPRFCKKGEAYAYALGAKSKISSSSRSRGKSPEESRGASPPKEERRNFLRERLLEAQANTPQQQTVVQETSESKAIATMASVGLALDTAVTPEIQQPLVTEVNDSQQKIEDSITAVVKNEHIETVTIDASNCKEEDQVSPDTAIGDGPNDDGKETIEKKDNDCEIVFETAESRQASPLTYEEPQPLPIVTVMERQSRENPVHLNTTSFGYMPFHSPAQMVPRTPDISMTGGNYMNSPMSYDQVPRTPNYGRRLNSYLTSPSPSPRPPVQRQIQSDWLNGALPPLPSPIVLQKVDMSASETDSSFSCKPHTSNAPSTWTSSQCLVPNKFPQSAHPTSCASMSPVSKRGHSQDSLHESFASSSQAMVSRDQQVRPAPTPAHSLVEQVNGSSQHASPQHLQAASTAVPSCEQTTLKKTVLYNSCSDKSPKESSRALTLIGEESSILETAKLVSSASNSTASDNMTEQDVGIVKGEVKNKVTGKSNDQLVPNDNDCDRSFSFPALIRSGENTMVAEVKPACAYKAVPKIIKETNHSTPRNMTKIKMDNLQPSTSSGGQNVIDKPYHNGQARKHFDLLHDIFLKKASEDNIPSNSLLRKSLIKSTRPSSEVDTRPPNEISMRRSSEIGNRPSNEKPHAINILGKKATCPSTSVVSSRLSLTNNPLVTARDRINLNSREMVPPFVHRMSSQDNSSTPAIKPFRRAMTKLKDVIKTPSKVVRHSKLESNEISGSLTSRDSENRKSLAKAPSANIMTVSKDYSTQPSNIPHLISSIRMPGTDLTIAPYVTVPVPLEMRMSDCAPSDSFATQNTMAPQLNPPATSYPNNNESSDGQTILGEPSTKPKGKRKTLIKRITRRDKFTGEVEVSQVSQVTTLDSNGQEKSQVTAVYLQPSSGTFTVNRIPNSSSVIIEDVTSQMTEQTLSDKGLSRDRGQANKDASSKRKV